MSGAPRHRAYERFVKALQGETLSCIAASRSAELGTGCAGIMEVRDNSKPGDRIKTFDLHCQACGSTEHLAGEEEPHPPWDEAAVVLMADEHLMHQQPCCPNDGTPVVFTSLPNPRRRARYRISCFYCGRQVDLDWPPSESRR